jgi:hypothetical protein
VRSLFEGTGVELEFEHSSLDFLTDSAEALLQEYERDLPPIVAAKAMLQPQGKWDALRADLLDLYEETNAADDGSYRQTAEYLVIKASSG